MLSNPASLSSHDQKIVFLSFPAREDVVEDSIFLFFHGMIQVSKKGMMAFYALFNGETEQKPIIAA